MDYYLIVFIAVAFSVAMAVLAARAHFRALSDRVKSEIVPEIFRPFLLLTITDPMSDNYPHDFIVPENVKVVTPAGVIENLKLNNGDVVTFKLNGEIKLCVLDEPRTLLNEFVFHFTNPAG